ncbi:MAG: hypothetical protein Q9218_007746, partial [Villophora microphyllina]
MAQDQWSQYLVHLPELRIIICKQCQHAVWPTEITGHLKGPQHRVKRSLAKTIQESVHTWDVIAHPSQLVALEHATDPIPGLPVYLDGLRCQQEGCPYIGRETNSMKAHFRQQHPGVRGKRGKGSHHFKGVDVPLWDEGVACQRLFIRLKGSHYFSVDVDRATLPPRDDVVRGELRSMTTARQAMLDERMQTVEDGEEGTEFVPWLERTGWPKYLRGLDRREGLALIAPPDEDEEPLVWMIWQAMEGLVKHSQATAVEAGYYVRMEVVRTEKAQTKYQPLQPYMDKDSVVQHALPWKQMVAFFVRTRGREQEGPRYRFNEREKQELKRLVRRARTLLREQGKRTVGDRPSSSGSGDSRSSQQSGQRSSSDRSVASHGSSRPSVRVGGMKRACLRFCIALLARKSHGSEYGMPLICAMAVLGMREGGWATPENYPPVMSRIIKVARFMLIQLVMQDVEEDWEELGLNEPNVLKPVVRFMDEYMIRGSRSPMQWILDTRAYGMKIHYNTTALGDVDWVGEQIRYKAIEFDMDQFRGMVHGLVAQCRDLLVQKVMRCEEAELPKIPWSRLRDDPTRDGMGHSFVEDERNGWATDDRLWLAQRLLRRGEFRTRGVVRDRAWTAEWEQCIVEWRELFLILVHITGGQPARGPEIMSIRHRSSGLGEGRNVFIENGLVTTVTRYHKGYSLSGNVKVINRYLPRAVGEQLVWYLVYVLPALEAWKRIDGGQEFRGSCKLWVDDRVAWNTTRMSRVMSGVFEASMGLTMGVQAYRNVSIAISRRFLRQQFGTDAEKEEEAEEDEMDDMQAGHGTHVAGIVYARGIAEQSGVVASKREGFRRVSENWHEFLGFETMGEEGKRAREVPGERTSGEEARETKRRRLTMVRSLDLRRELVRMMGAGSTFRGLQEEMVGAVVRGVSRVMGIMPTGGGKSLIFMLPAFCSPGGVTVVVVPLIALRQDMTRRCRELGVRCRSWSSTHPPDDAQIVLVTPESALGEGFVRFLNRLRKQGRLDRIVIDECHVVLNQQPDFRPKLREMARLNQAQVQIVALTATLPVEEEGRWLRRMEVEREDVTMFRSATTRGNIGYRIYSMQARGSRPQEEELLALIGRKREGLQEGEKMVVYCMSVGDCQGLAAAMGCEAYFHDAADKGAVLERFVGRKRDGSMVEARVQHDLVVATSAFGMGIDVARIRVIMHVSEPREMLAYAQESGRAGRDGLRSEAIVIRGRMKGQRVRTEDERASRGRAVVKEFLGGGCQRVVMDGYLDGRRDRSGCEDGEERCQGCGGADVV